MQREDKIWSGIAERLLHLVISDDPTVSEHVSTLDYYQQAEFAFTARRPSCRLQSPRAVPRVR